MAIERLANNAQTILASAIDNSAPTISVASAVSFPGSGNFRIRIGDELMLVTGVSGTTWTVIRGVESTTPVAHSSGAVVTQVLTAGVLNAFLVPTGMIMPFAGATAPNGWLICDSSAVSRTTYADLFSVIGTAWGSGNGSTTFNLPDFRRRVAVGSGGTGTGILGNAVGNTGGAETHTLTIAEMPSHTHTPAANTQLFSVPGGSNLVAGGTTYNAGGTLTNTGGGGAHNNIQPSAVVLMCIKT